MDRSWWRTRARRMLTGCKTGPLFRTDRKARTSAATNDVDSPIGAGAAVLPFEIYTAGYDDGPNKLRHSGLTRAAEGVRRRRC
ncbi:hypothetical protein AB0B25_00165 [Nocardia sp. NPDC049190]|uniref:hypothetical protein n=1 Tax=Nocardia sp. NPDC049190 TaxID=3155650 RepID=UPI0033EDADEF